MWIVSTRSILNRNRFSNNKITYRPNGIRFTASPATSEFKKRWTPKAGDIASFKHGGYLHGSKKPKFPALYRVRDDLSWDDVVNNWAAPHTKPLQGYFTKPIHSLLVLSIYFVVLICLFRYSNLRVFSHSSESDQKNEEREISAQGVLEKNWKQTQIVFRFRSGNGIRSLGTTKLGQGHSTTIGSYKGKYTSSIWLSRIILVPSLSPTQPQARVLLTYHRYRMKRALEGAFPELDWKAAALKGSTILLKLKKT